MVNQINTIQRVTTVDNGFIIEREGRKLIASNQHLIDLLTTYFREKFEMPCQVGDIFEVEINIVDVKNIRTEIKTDEISLF